MKMLIILNAALIGLFSSCLPCKETVQTNTSLYDHKWLLKKIYNGNDREVVNTKAFIRFNKEKGSAGGNGGCNSFGSSFTINNDGISFKDIFSTKMYCEEVQKIENSFLDGLKKINRFEIKDKMLLLYHDKELLLEFVTDEEKKSTR